MSAIISLTCFKIKVLHSTQQAIITLTNKITSSLDTGDLVTGVFLDLKKAFELLTKILLDKMHACGIRGNILRWLPNRRLPNKQISVSFL